MNWCFTANRFVEETRCWNCLYVYFGIVNVLFRFYSLANRGLLLTCQAALIFAFSPWVPKLRYTVGRLGSGKGEGPGGLWEVYGIG